MSTTIHARRLRIAANLFSQDAPQDQETGGAAQLFLANDTDIELGIFVGDPAAGTIVDDKDDWHEITVQLYTPSPDQKPPAASDDPVASATIAAAALTLPKWSEWNSRTSQHAKASFTAAQLNLDDSLLVDGKLWLVVSLTTTHNPPKNTTLAAGLIDAINPGFRSLGAALAYGKQVGTEDLALAAGSGSVVFPNAFEGVPQFVAATVSMPDGNGAMLTVHPYNLSATGFDYYLTGATPDADHVLRWECYNVTVTDAPGIKLGTDTLGSGETDGTITFANAFAVAPRVVIAQVSMPNGNGAILTVHPHTITKTGFAYQLSGATPDASHVLRYLALL